jgi:hypothetical protein
VVEVMVWRMSSVLRTRSPSCRGAVSGRSVTTASAKIDATSSFTRNRDAAERGVCRELRLHRCVGQITATGSGSIRTHPAGATTPTMRARHLADQITRPTGLPNRKSPAKTALARILVNDNNCARSIADARCVEKLPGRQRCTLDVESIARIDPVDEGAGFLGAGKRTVELDVETVGVTAAMI